MNKMNDYRIQDIMIAAMSHLIHDEDLVFHGVSSHMPMISLMLAKETHAKNAVYLNIPGGVDPVGVTMKKYTSAGDELFHKAVAEITLAEVFDLSMRGDLDVAFLSGIQFDRQGNVNASVIGDYHKPKVRMPGGAGSAVLIPTAKRAIIWRTKHDIRTFVDKVDFVTTKGNIDRIVTPLCVFKYVQGELLLDTIHPTSCLEEVIENTGFPVYYDEVQYTEAPTKEELRILNRIDPKDYRSIEFKEV